MSMTDVIIILVGVNLCVFMIAVAGRIGSRTWMIKRSRDLLLRKYDLESDTRERYRGTVEGMELLVQLPYVDTPSGIELTLMRGAPDITIEAGREGNHLPEIVTGDSELDAAVELRGDEAVGVALATVGSRDLLLECTRAGWRYHQGRLAWQSRSPDDDVDAMVTKGLFLARALTRTAEQRFSILGRLARSHALPGVRRRALEALWRYRRADDSTAEALAVARGDACDWVRALAARFLGDGELLARIAGRSDHEQGIREAIEGLAAHHHRRLEVLLEAWLATPSPHRQRLAAAADVAAASGAAWWEEPMLRLLAIPEDGARLHAARALGAIRRRSSIPGLAEAREATRASSVRRAIDAAIAAIVAASGRAPDGALSLAQGEGGALTVVPDEG